jgi:hypothetical protein
MITDPEWIRRKKLEVKQGLAVILEEDPEGMKSSETEIQVALRKKAKDYIWEKLS